MMKKAVILGAGLATRLYPITYNIPKVLVNYKQHTILKHLYEIYEYQVDEIIVVVHSKFKDLVEAYAEQEQLNIVVKTIDEPHGSAYALTHIDGLEGHNVILNWCDVIPSTYYIKWNQDTIYTYGDECRYNFTCEDGKGVIRNVGRTGGNVVGVYQVKNWSYPKTEHMDFVDMIDPSGFVEHKLSNLVDLGDMPKLLKAHETPSLSREFNCVRIGQDKVSKTAVNKKGLELQAKELAWYRQTISKSVPKILSILDTSFTMEKIDGLPMYKFLNRAPADLAIKTTSDILRSLEFSQYASSVSEETIKSDFKKEIIDKVLDRCKSIEPMLNAFGDITEVNGIKLGRLKPMLYQAYNHLIHYQLKMSIDKKYRLIHGDPNFSNTFITKDQIKFIDPRGYFGNTELYGPRIYDEAKVLYALSGYDEFNASPDWGNIDVMSGGKCSILMHSLTDLDAQDFPQFNQYHHLWVAIIWIALAGYFKNNPIKSIAAYYHGMYLLSYSLCKMGRRLQDGSVSHDTELVTATLLTKNPGKWLLTDLETGQKYRPIENTDKTHQWEQI
ncbi:hypothetical protein KNT64_gp075 [Pseudomonas phage PspYZU05]|uniref:Nucleotidyl transferase domain-containing protein n=1 Tax=Pseudomonas phage PspYZU05 TaxID=1983556 RepID=A0A2U7NN01_9CAUD|nr:hypothetical protein KNT64_gp075 [Pseudomonas phage PspYZU05]ASD52027.1 hypothetical protein PspYZU05_75 [Pseudomonas phage PspYZU05]